jgi:hypothetical protein
VYTKPVKIDLWRSPLNLQISVGHGVACVYLGAAQWPRRSKRLAFQSGATPLHARGLSGGEIPRRQNLSIDCTIKLIIARCEL